MKCSEIMKNDVECCETKTSVAEVAERMRSRNIGFLPVCDDKGAVVGTITDRDLALRVLAEGREAGSTTANDVMTREVVACGPDDDLGVVEQLMSQYKKSRILCLDAQKHPIGVVSLSDIAERETGGKASAILRSVAQREARA